MARTYGAEFPERPLMSVLSDLLGMRHFTTSRGSTVRKDFMEELARALGIEVNDKVKDALTLACIASATRTPEDAKWLSTGATVTDVALQQIINGLIEFGVPGRSAPMPDVDTFVAVPGEEDPLPDLFDPEQVSDERTRRLMEIVTREGQDRFRTAIMDAYGFRCAVTGYDAVEALEAAHIVPYMGPGTNRVSNGLLLRTDVHRLFDRGALAIDERSFKVLVKPHLLVTHYRVFAGTQLRLPVRIADRPAPVALRDHRLWAGLEDGLD